MPSERWSRSPSNGTKATASFCLFSCSIFSSASLSRASHSFRSLLPSSNLTRRSASGTSPDSIDSTTASRRLRAASKVSLASLASTGQGCPHGAAFQTVFCEGVREMRRLGECTPPLVGCRRFPNAPSMPAAIIRRQRCSWDDGWRPGYSARAGGNSRRGGIPQGGASRPVLPSSPDGKQMKIHGMIRLGIAIAVWAACPGARGESLAIATYNVGNYGPADRLTETGYRSDYPKPEDEKSALRARHRPARRGHPRDPGDGRTEAHLEELRRRSEGRGDRLSLCGLGEGTHTERHLALLSRRPLLSVRNHDDLECTYLGGTGQGEARAARGRGGRGRRRDSRCSCVHLKSRLTGEPDDPGGAAPAGRRRPPRFATASAAAFRTGGRPAS